MPKSIQQLLSIVATIALCFAIIKWNWGLAIFLGTLAALFFGVHSWRKASGFARILPAAILLISVGLVYAVSPGPYVGAMVIIHRLTGAGSHMNTWYNFIYRPHVELCTGRFGSEGFNTIYTDYIVQWQLLCGL
ncbi:hypothetical protein [Roseiconus lacunae]|uniref:Uncharacterized protein n=1 Tax=Roseiconus lacunae TaxID=2605694 RepID=A0ABT7PSL0_9BACT|nr:hypothetical protein [Roseiconus lacunae]MDM4019484.1 hypothetical protein [Roseiconus lacunae]